MTINLAKLNAIKTPTPFLVMDLEKIRNNYRRLQSLLPDFKIFYAMKCNPEAEILKALKDEGSYFEIASIGELERLKAIGVEPKDVIFSNPVKIVEHIELAFKEGLYRFAVDSVEEIRKIADHAPGSEVYARVSVSNHGSIINLSNKFGVDTEHVVALLGLAKDYGLNPTGLSFHVGSQSENIHLWDAAIKEMGDIIKRLNKVEIQIKTINIGGGIPIKYTDPVPDMEDIAKRVLKNVKEYLPEGVELLCEPGRALVGDAGVIATSVIGKAIRPNQEWLYLDAGRFQAFNEMFESEELRYPVNTSRQDHEYQAERLYTLTGPTCDSYDTIMQNISLPADMQLKDRVYFASAGGYTHVYGAPFNDFPVPKVVYKQFIDDL